MPVHEDGKLFESLILEGAQAGLSWETILKKRANYRVAFDGFDAAKIAAAIQNAKAFLDIQQEFGSFDAYIWRFVDGTPIRNAWRSLKELPAATPESKAMSKELLNRGFKFVGPTICYAFMQAVGMVNDHVVDCFRYDQAG